MSRKYVCHYCKDKFVKEELIQVTKTMRACKKCHNEKVKESQEYKELIEYICKGFSIKSPTGLQLKQIKEFKNSGYSYKEMEWTLYYIYCVLRKVINKEKSLGLVPFYYEEAKEHFKIIKKNSEVDITENRVEVVIKRKKKTSNNIGATRIIKMI